MPPLSERRHGRRTPPIGGGDVPSPLARVAPATRRRSRESQEENRGRPTRERRRFPGPERFTSPAAEWRHPRSPGVGQGIPTRENAAAPRPEKTFPYGCLGARRRAV